MRTVELSNAKQGSLTVVGTGIRALQHTSLYVTRLIEEADRVYTVVTDPLTFNWLCSLNPVCEDLKYLYQFVDPAQPDLGVRRARTETYAAMTELLVSAVREGHRVVAVFYGHPGVFVASSHAAIKQLREEGFAAEMLPAISAEDCLFADLGVDPGRKGCAQFEASNFLFWEHAVNPASGLILWQIGVLGDRSLQRLRPVEAALPLLVEKLAGYFGADHRVALYDAMYSPHSTGRIEWLGLSELPNAHVSLTTTLYCPPAIRAEPDRRVWERLGLTCPA